MNRSFRAIHLIGLSVLAATALWAAWAAAPATTNALPHTTVLDAASNAATRVVEEHKDLLTFGLDRVEPLNTTVLGQPVWRFIAAVIYLLLAFYSSKALDWLITGRLKKWAAKTETEFDDLLLEVVHGPIKVIAFVIFLHVGLRMFTYPAVLEVYLSKGLQIVVAWSLTYMAVKGVRILLGYWQRKLSHQPDRVLDEQLFPLLRKVLTAAIVLVAVLLTCENVGININSVLAGLSIGGLALGLAAQDTVANLFGAVAIFLDKPFQLGDRIRIDTFDGSVESVGLRSTQVRNLDGHLVTIPNKTVGNATITNVSRRPNIKTEMGLGIAYDTSPTKIREATAILEEIYRAEPKTTDLIIGFDRFADSSLNLKIVHWWGGLDFKEYVAGMHELNLRVKERFDTAGIAFAFPTQTVYLRQEGAVAPITRNP